MNHYNFNYSEEIEQMINESIAKRSLKNKKKIEKLSEFLRNLIEEEYKRHK